MTHLPSHKHGTRDLLGLSLGALGIVYGDIGTSPLYSMRECFHGEHGVHPTHDNVLGVLSLVFWVLIVTISIKYLIFVMRADNRGEGGILALMALIPKKLRRVGPEGHWVLVALGIFGAALLYGDGIITPAISVLSAVEGLTVATPVLGAYIVPIAVVILVALFLFQSRGTAGVATVFGPVTLVWFLVLATLGAAEVLRHPSVLAAVNPAQGAAFFLRNGWHGYIVLGSVFLVVTGGEALYADMGHFGTGAIRIDWFTIVLPALLLNYFGQGALLLREPAAAVNPFYLLAPSWALYPLIVLATAAAVIASQAVISGGYSLTMQAVQLGFSPRMRIDHTSRTEYGQIYIPAVNWALLTGCIFIVLAFRSSTHLAAAYGVAVTSTMVITTVLFYVVSRRVWHWNALSAGALAAFFLVIDLAFFGANVIKVAKGGWLPLLLAGLVFSVMTTWKNGRKILNERLRTLSRPLDDFLAGIEARRPLRVPGTAVFMNGVATRTPPALVRNLEHNKVLHERIVFVTVKTRQVPFVPTEQRLEVEALGGGCYRLRIYFGFMEEPNIPKVLASISDPEIAIDPQATTFFLGRQTIIATRRRAGMARWRERLFSRISLNATTATAYFCIPP